ncbi:tRNA pseudouridine(38-40) synthase TruA [Thermoanaerobacterium thermosaccharolyticum]|uniref:tRNA pseudouridine synthase A n=2 Tax=Thermoanaerobacterium thermosaccharolyticum TaxID=1517 RepID=A0A231VDH1_THETR|nr:tRNA pseudouridine(38-40) synthase TruA [Thermoanaerobacterium thermosaccharolyticum]
MRFKMRNIVLVIEYDGTNYHGWQIQKNVVTIQETITKAIKKITNEDVDLIGSSRTDAGVHALHQVANFKTCTNIPTSKIPNALNSVLPADIVIKDAFEADMDFHSRYSAKGKRYKYIIYNRRFSSPILKNYSWHISKSLDVEKMRESLKYLEGTHDFSAFKASGSSVKSPVRTVRDISLKKNGFNVEFEIEADGFLYNMVRIIVGTIVDVGLGKINPIDVKEILDSKNRCMAGKTAPPQGLFLTKIYY